MGMVPEAGAALVAHPGIKAISFTGGTQTGRLIGEQAGRDLKKVSLELGGKNPTLVFADADLDEAVDGAARAAFSNQGQICLCGSRILVEQSIYPQFRDALAARVRSLHVGDPSEAMTQVGALVSAAHRDKVLSYIQLAKDEGGHILCGGLSKIVEGRCEKGYFVAPTLLDGLPADCRTNQEEIFGPVATLMPFETEEEAIALANGTQYGLAASVWTSDVNTAHRVGQALESGIVWINCWMERDLRTPFGGVKSSGMGREGGWYALRFFTEPKNICIKDSDSFMINEIITSPGAPEPVGAYPHARRIGNFLYLSGVGPRQPNSDAIPGVESECRRHDCNLRYRSADPVGPR